MMDCVLPFSLSNSELHLTAPYRPVAQYLTPASDALSAPTGTGETKDMWELLLPCLIRRGRPRPVVRASQPSFIPAFYNATQPVHTYGTVGGSCKEFV